MMLSLALLFRVHPRELEGMDDTTLATVLALLEESHGGA
jgi:hypothetical protein